MIIKFGFHNLYAEEEEDEHMCDVCDRTYHSVKRLTVHQRKKRHFG